jgi:hypothetical protein
MGGSKLTGGCQCGAVRYSLASAPTGASICHCRMCQKATGSPYGAYAPMAREALVFTRGAPKIFRSSEIAERGFCAECGTPLTYRNVTSQRISVTICSLDDPELTPPEFQLDPAAAVSWVSDCLTKPAESVEDFLKTRGVTKVGTRQHPDHD